MILPSLFRKRPTSGRRVAVRTHAYNPESATLEDELLHLIAKQSRRVPIAAFLAAIIIAAFAAEYLPRYIWGSWLVAVAVVLLIRLLILPRLPHMKHSSAQDRIHIAIALSILNGLVHGSSLFFFPLLPEFERAIQSVILTALCTGAVATTAGYLPIFLGYLIPAFAAMVPLWIISPGLPEAGWREVALGLLLLIFGLLLIGLARDAHRVFRESFEIREKERQLNHQLSRALADAEAANNAKTRFLASASHDLRQPIHTLSLFSAALSMRELDEKTRDITNHINTALDTLASQLDALLDISKLDAGVVEIRTSIIDLRQLLDNIEQEYKPLCEEKGLLLTSQHCDPLPPVKTDPVLLERIIRNLLSNAVKYTDVGQITLSTEKRAGKYYLRIEDTGQGIAESEQKKIFEEFYQVGNPERDRNKGLGLGLSIVKRLTNMLNIELNMESRPGLGSRFELELPQPVAHIENTNDDQEPEVNNNFPYQHVLVVDDEAEVRIGMQTLLDSMGFSVDVADSTEQAVEMATRHPPQLVLADLRLRGTDNGINTIKAVRSLVPNVPALLISGDTAPNRLREAKLAGIEMLHKPVAPQVLRQSIQNACGGHHSNN